MKDIIRIIRQSTHQSQFIHVVEPLGFFVNEDEDKAYLVMELCSGGDLRGYIKNLQKIGAEIGDKKCWEFVTSIVSAVNQLHIHNIIHGDLKPENVLLTENFKVKLADFGLTRKLQQGREYQTYHGGTKFYLAPEIQKDEINQILAAEKQNQKLPFKRVTQTKAVDIWAIGIMLYELLAQHHPFIHSDDDLADISDIQIAHRIVTEEPSELPSHYPDSLRNLIKAMLSKNGFDEDNFLLQDDDDDDNDLNHSSENRKKGAEDSNQKKGKKVIVNADAQDDAEDNVYKFDFDKELQLQREQEKLKDAIGKKKKKKKKKKITSAPTEELEKQKKEQEAQFKIREQKLKEKRWRQEQHRAVRERKQQQKLKKDQELQEKMRIREAEVLAEAERNDQEEL
ncbi:MAG: putative G2-specific protein kinase, partial [Streblomastix strix]